MGNSLMSTSYQSYPTSIRSESTIFDQVYRGYRRRPATISLNVQWIPVAESSGSYRWSGADNQDRKLKTLTFFGTGEMRGQQTKATTPPSSDYTDAYLSALASKPIPTRHINRLSTSVYNNTAPIPLRPTNIPSSSTSFTTNRSTETSQTRLIHIDTEPIVKPVPSPTPSLSPSSSSIRSSNYSSSFVSPSTTMSTVSKSYEPFSTTQYSSPQSQTFTSSYSTLLRSSPTTTNTFPDSLTNNQRTYTTVSNRYQPPPTTTAAKPTQTSLTSSTFSSIRSGDTAYDNIFKPLPPYSLQAYPPSNSYITTSTHSSTSSSSSSSLPSGSIYKPLVSFQAAPFSSFKTSSTTTTTVPTTTESILTSTSTVDRSIDRPETLVFRSSPIRSPPHESPVKQEEISKELEQSEKEEATRVTSDPIQILENTLSKYDTLINQISEVLASVSPLSSSISTLSPGKSVLDYQLSSDDSPTLQQNPIDNEVSETHSTPIPEEVIVEPKKNSHLIREDSYDKIVSAVSELENELTRSTEFTPTLATNVEEEQVIESTPPRVIDQQQQEKDHEEEPKKADETPVEQEQEEEPKKADETPVEQEQEEEPKKADETPVEQEQEEEPKKAIETPVEQEQEEEPKKADETSVVQEAPTVEISENIPTDGTQAPDQIVVDLPPDTTISSGKNASGDLVLTLENDTETTEITIRKKHEKHVRWSESVVDNEDDEEDEEDEEDEGDDSSPTIPMGEITETSDSLTTAASSKEEGEGEGGGDETAVIDQLESKTDDELVTTLDALKLPAASVDQYNTDSTTSATLEDQSVEQATVTESTNQDEVVKDITEQIAPEVEEKNFETSHDVIVSQPLIQSPIETLADVISTRYISSDVYHGYQGEHNSFAPDDHQLEVEHDETTKSLIASLRETISKPITPIIETIQDIVGSLQTTSSSSDTEIITQEEEKPSLASSAPVNVEQEQNEESKVSTSEENVESKSILETVRETITAPISAVTETVKEFVTQLQSDQRDTSAITIEHEDLTNSTSDNQLAENIEQTTSTALDTVTPNTSSSEQTYQPIIESAETPLSTITLEQTQEIPSTPAVENAETIINEEIKEVETTSDEQKIEQELVPTIVNATENVHEDTSDEVVTSQNEPIVEVEPLLEESLKAEIKEVNTESNEQRVEQELTPTTVDVTENISEDTSSKVVSSLNESVVATESFDETPAKEETKEVEAESNEQHVEEEPVPTTGDVTEDTSNKTVSEQDETIVATEPIFETPSMKEEIKEVDTESNEQRVEQELASTTVDVTENISEDTSGEAVSSLNESTVATEPDVEASTMEIPDVKEEIIASETTKVENVTPSKEISSVFDIRTVANVTLTHDQIESLPSLSSTFSRPTKIEESVDDQTRQEKMLVDEQVEHAETVETKTTLDIIRDVITHPIDTISNTLQNVLLTSSNEQVTNESELSAQIIEATEVISVDENKDEKTTLETLREVITHPISAISEQIQHVLSSSTSTSHEEQVEQVSSETLQSSPPNNSEQTTSTDVNIDNTDQTTLEKMREFITHPINSITETIQQVISSTTIKEENHEPSVEIESEQKQDSETVENKSLFETIRETITSPIAALTEKVQHIVSNTTESTSFHEDSDEVDNSNLLTTEDHQMIQELIATMIDSALSHISILPNQSESFSSAEGSELTSPVTVLANEDRTEASQSSSFQHEKDLSFDQDTLTSEMTNVTWTDLVEGKSSEINEIPAAITTNNAVEIQSASPSIDGITQRSSYESDSNSVITALENPSMRTNNDYREVSPANIEDEDSLELIHALQGHSIVLPTTNEKELDEQRLSKPDKSSSSATTSSQVTSSDRYVSYAIHEMGSSSQERLPALPVAADLPVYELVATGSNEHQDANVQSQILINPNEAATKDDDLTEFDATENLTSYSDDILIQKLHASAPDRATNLDAASSTDEDVDDFEEHDVSNLYRIVDQMTQHSSSLSGADGQAFHRYDLLTTSSNSNESMSKPHNDDFYVIPGFPGLWRPSADDNSTHSPLANDADDESQSNDDRHASNNRVKLRTNIRKINVNSTQITTEQSNDVFDRPLNDFPFDVSETESFKTCASTLNSSSNSKQQKIDEPIVTEPDENGSPEEKIYLIRERERGVSLPVTMKIDYDDMALRLSTSTPIEAPVYLQSQGDPSSPLNFSEPMIKGETSSRASTPSLSSNDSEQQLHKFPPSSWLNTVNTTTTMIEGPDGPLESRTTILKSAKGPISVAECDSQGRFIQIENTSRSKSISLAHWTLRQENNHGEIINYKFPENTLLKPNHALKVFAQSNESDRRTGDLVASTLSTWYTDANVVTTLINAEGKDRASLTKKTLFS